MNLSCFNKEKFEANQINFLLSFFSSLAENADSEACIFISTNDITHSFYGKNKDKEDALESFVTTLKSYLKFNSMLNVTFKFKINNFWYRISFLIKETFVFYCYPFLISEISMHKSDNEKIIEKIIDAKFFKNETISASGAFTFGPSKMLKDLIELKDETGVLSKLALAYPELICPQVI
jgi:hypothetical protein